MLKYLAQQSSDEGAFFVAARHVCLIRLSTRSVTVP
jgi:hypothetical protein